MTPDQMIPKSNTEQLLISLINDDPDPVQDMVPKSNVEHYLKECVLRYNCEHCPEPISNVDILLKELRDKLIDEGGGGGSDENRLNLLAKEELTQVTYDDLSGVTSIKSYLFYGIDSIQSVQIPGSVTNIYNYSFYMLLKDAEILQILICQTH